MTPVLSIKNLKVTFPGQAHAAVDGVDMHIEQGQMHALVGESGSGKSLTALSILRLLPSSATVSCDAIAFAGDDIASWSEAKLRTLRGGKIGMIFQEPLTALNPLHNIEKQICENILIHQQLSPAAVRARCLELLQQVQLPDPETMLGRYPHQLSGGQRQRVMIAMALANNPSLLIADEPTTALDVTVQEAILDLLKQLQRDLNLGVLLITHDLGIVQRYAEQVSVMCAGKIVEQGATETVLAAPTHKYTRHLLATKPGGIAPAMPADAATLLHVEKLSVEFQQREGWLGKRTQFTAVSGADISVARGTTLGIVGESGSGKSTLAMAILRLLPSTGSIVLGDTRLDSLSGNAVRPFRSRMQVVFQDPWGTLNPRMTIGQIIAEGLEVHRKDLNQTQRDEKVCAILQEVDLDTDMRNRYPHEFSGGQRQRIAIARALILEPELLILDEPTSALDRSVQYQVLELLRSIQERHNLTYLFISHDLRVVRSVSHSLVVMKDGAIVESGLTEQVFTSPQQPYTQRLIHSAFDETVKYQVSS